MQENEGTGGPVADTIHHFRTIVEGVYNPARSRLANESWNFGISLIASLNSIPNAGPPNSDFTCGDADLTGTSTHAAAESNFIAEGGIDDFDPADYGATILGEALYTFLTTAGVISDQVICQQATIYPMKRATNASGKPVYKVCQNAAGAAKCIVTGPGGGTLATGTNTGNMLPVQTAVTVSLRTVNTSARGRGRFYMPPPSAVPHLGADGLYGGSVAMAAAAKTFLGDLALSAPSNVEVRPVVVGLSAQDLAFVVQEVRVGDVFDSQRRRRRQITEVYQVGEVTY